MRIFLDKGFEQTTTGMIAGEVGISKRTLYGLYEDKDSLFRAVVQHAIRQTEIPASQLAALDIEDLEGTLRTTADICIGQIVSPLGLKLQRLMHVSSFRFPDLITMAYLHTMKPVEDFLCAILSHHARAGVIAIDDPYVSARVFLAIVIGSPIRGATLGVETDNVSRNTLVSGGLKMFLRSIRPD